MPEEQKKRRRLGATDKRGTPRTVDQTAPAPDTPVGGASPRARRAEQLRRQRIAERVDARAAGPRQRTRGRTAAAQASRAAALGAATQVPNQFVEDVATSPTQARAASTAAPTPRRDLLTADQIGQDFSAALQDRAAQLGGRQGGIDNTGRPIAQGGRADRRRGTFSVVGPSDEQNRRLQASLQRIDAGRRAIGVGGLTREEASFARRLGRDNPALARQFVANIGAQQRQQSQAGAQRDRLASEQNIARARLQAEQAEGAARRAVQTRGQDLDFRASTADRIARAEQDRQSRRLTRQQRDREQSQRLATLASQTAQQLAPEDQELQNQISGFVANTPNADLQNTQALASFGSGPAQRLFQAARGETSGFFSRDPGNPVGLQDVESSILALSPQQQQDLRARFPEEFRQFDIVTSLLGLPPQEDQFSANP